MIKPLGASCIPRAIFFILLLSSSSGFWQATHHPQAGSGRGMLKAFPGLLQGSGQQAIPDESLVFFFCECSVICGPSHSPSLSLDSLTIIHTGWPGTPRDLPVSAFWMLRLNVCNTMPGDPGLSKSYPCCCPQLGSHQENQHPCLSFVSTTHELGAQTNMQVYIHIK